MNIQRRLDQIIKKGAEIYFPNLAASAALDTAALVGKGILFYCFPYPDPLRWGHHLSFDRVGDDGIYLTFLLNGIVEATISAVEDPEQSEMLARWRSEGNFPAAHAKHIAHLRKWNNYQEE